MSEGKKILLVVDRVGRQFIGESVEETDSSVTIKDPLMVIERVLPSPDPNQSQVQFNMAPVLQTFKVGNLKLKWISISQVDDEKFISAFDDILMKLRAARSGIETATHLPPNMRSR